jgi:hypothetical protein
MAEAWLSTVTKLTEFFSADQIEASARRTKFVQRASKITGKLFLALVTFGRWSAPKTSLAQLAAKAAQIEQPVEVTPEALQQRMNARAVAFLQDLLQTAFTKLHTGDLVCDEALFAPFARVHIADSTGFGLPDSLQAQFPGAGGSGCKAGAKIQLVWEYKSHSFDHFALSPWNVPDNKYVDTVTALARPHALFLFDLGYFKLTAFATIAAAQAYFLSRLNHQTTLLEVRGGRVHPLELARVLGKESRPLLEKAILLGARARVAARLIAVRMPDAVVNTRRRQARRVAKKRGYTPSQAHLTLLAWNLYTALGLAHGASSAGRGDRSTLPTGGQGVAAARRPSAPRGSPAGGHAPLGQRCRTRRGPVGPLLRGALRHRPVQASRPRTCPRAPDAR